jgi:hypothetical protein
MCFGNYYVIRRICYVQDKFVLSQKRNENHQLRVSNAIAIVPLVGLSHGGPISFAGVQNMRKFWDHPHFEF